MSLAHFFINRKKSTESTFLFTVFVEHFSLLDCLRDKDWIRTHFYQICSLDREREDWLFEHDVQNVDLLCVVVWHRTFHPFSQRTAVVWWKIVSQIFDTCLHEFVWKILCKVFSHYPIDPTMKNVNTRKTTCFQQHSLVSMQADEIYVDFDTMFVDRSIPLHLSISNIEKKPSNLSLKSIAY